MREEAETPEMLGSLRRRAVAIPVNALDGWSTQAFGGGTAIAMGSRSADSTMFGFWGTAIFEGSRGTIREGVSYSC